MTHVSIRLREWCDDDAPAVLQAFESPDLRHQSPWPVVTLQDAVGWIASWKGVGHAFAVTVGEQVAGNVAVVGIDAHDNGWVSYWVVPAFRGLGVATAATGELARWAFAERGLYRLELGHRTNNPASCRVATKAGFLPEGIERGKLCYEGVRYDVERHARLATDR
ncbi:GNAT family N-acetyltransferase [Nonomuraea sp. KC401]|uniref:GNAT family N-acetyltransferase n=1 Tax=unclassified Nonomuraea TaxID=2593643 RepID=UPI0010FEB4FC|nr:GNAT family protein [Nonomuraea sp. KC401]NBE91699.1 GNAT family N-acetyltransferase [Nonomuraea sp. K271]TLF85843.1 GNAT family N-acetyltransferase [Nonomuraea sp. KC401]